MHLVKSVGITGPNQFLLRRGDGGSDLLFDLERDEVSFTDSVFQYRPLNGEMDSNLHAFFSKMNGTRFSEWPQDDLDKLGVFLSWDWYDFESDSYYRTTFIPRG